MVRLVVEPYLATVVACGSLNEFGSKIRNHPFIPEIIDGSKLWALAFAEPQGRFNLADLTTTATANNGSYLLSGHKSVVINGPNANFSLSRCVRVSIETKQVSLCSSYLVMQRG